nr:MAG TPA: hypothetical protein [Caudoviricetes sp.]
MPRRRAGFFFLSSFIVFLFFFVWLNLRANKGLYKSQRYTNTTQRP